MIVKALMAEGWAVQLKHAPEETSWEDTETHGFVKVKDAAGKVLCDVPGFQHNKKLGRVPERLSKMLGHLANRSRGSGHHPKRIQYSFTRMEGKNEKTRRHTLLEVKTRL